MNVNGFLLKKFESVLSQDLRATKTVGSFINIGYSINFVKFLKDPRFFLSGGSKIIILWEYESTNPLFTYKTAFDKTNCISLCDNCSFFVVSGNNNHIEFFNLRKSERLFNLSMKSDEIVCSIKLIENDSKLLSSSSKSINIWKVSTRQCLQIILLPLITLSSEIVLEFDDFEKLIISSKVNHLFSLKIGSKKISVLNENLAESNIVAIKFYDQGTKFITLESTKLQIWNFCSKVVISSLQLESKTIPHMELTRDQKFLILLSIMNKITVLNIDNGETMTKILPGDSILTFWLNVQDQQNL